MFTPETEVTITTGMGGREVGTYKQPLSGMAGCHEVWVDGNPSRARIALTRNIETTITFHDCPNCGCHEVHA